MDGSKRKMKGVRMFHIYQFILEKTIKLYWIGTKVNTVLGGVENFPTPGAVEQDRTISAMSEFPDGNL